MYKQHLSTNAKWTSDAGSEFGTVDENELYDQHLTLKA